MVPVDALLLSYDCEELPAQDSSSTSHYKSVNNVDTQAASRESPTPAKQTDHCQYNTQQDDVITHVHSPDENTNSTGLAWLLYTLATLWRNRRTPAIDI